MSHHLARVLQFTLALGVSCSSVGFLHVSDKLLVSATLLRIAVAPGCGYFHAGAIARYKVDRVISGDLAADTIAVVIGCPDLARSEYKQGSGSLKAFRIGDSHRLQLARTDADSIEYVFETDSIGTIQYPPDRLFYCVVADSQ